MLTQTDVEVTTPDGFVTTYTTHLDFLDTLRVLTEWTPSLSSESCCGSNQPLHRMAEMISYYLDAE